MEHIESHTGRFIGSLAPQLVKSATFRFSNKHVLYGRLRPYLNKAAAPDFEGHCSTEIFPIKPSPAVDRNFLLYWLLADETTARINETCSGARMPRADMNEVLGFDFPLPPLPEQRRIVALLDAAFEGIATAAVNAERNLQNARELFESHLAEVFSRRGEGWVETTLGGLCEVKHGFAFEGKYFSNEGEFVLLTPGNFYESGGYRDRGEKQKYYTGPIPREFVLKGGDLLVAMTEQAVGLLGSPILVPRSGKFLHNQRLGLVKRRPNVEWDARFLFHMFNLPAIRKAIQGSASGTKVRHTSPTKIGCIAVHVPLLPIQRRVVAHLDAISTETQRLSQIYEQKQAALAGLKRSLLHQAFNGEL
jgi:type I restriction enzyme S subunit